MSTFRASVLGFSSDSGVAKSTLVAECSKVRQVEDLFDPNKEWPILRQGESDLRMFSRRVYLIESSFTRWSHPTARDDSFRLERLLKEALGVPEDFFRVHSREHTNFNSTEVIRCPRLPTAQSLDRRFSLEHFELWTYLGAPEKLRGHCLKTNKHLNPGDVGYTMTCKSTKRQIQCHKWKSRGGWLLVAPRKCSFWSRTTRNGWDVVILCDPAPNRLQISGAPRVVDVRPFHGGPHGFIPEEFLGPHPIHSVHVNIDTSQVDLADPRLFYSNGRRRFLGSPAPSHSTISPDTDMSHPPSRDEREDRIANTTQTSRTMVSTSISGSEASSRHRIHIRPSSEPFVPRPEIERPPHKSLFDDLTYYYRNHAHLLGAIEDPFSTSLFLRKLVASHYSQLVGFVAHQAATMRSSGSMVPGKHGQAINEMQAAIESNWDKFRCAEYIEAMDTVMDQLGIPIYGDQHQQSTNAPLSLHPPHADVSHTPTNTFYLQPTPSPPSESENWRSSTPDFLYLHRELRLRLADHDRITVAAAVLTSAIGNRQRQKSTKWLKLLTLVVVFFLPFAAVAAIFGVGEQFAPGGQGGRFWEYWAVAVPVVLIVGLLGIVGWRLRELTRGMRRVGSCLNGGWLEEGEQL
ncbi:uncharacterized protein BCR38DRAFT_160158 [Pseudomassariella vexata]|uniref:Uncharacterized protein n=1 Tax=Pseudomassariella vexata TaxID=1141098 RepID=A0A1Y2E7M8_9PEZI|nr:uncharacterized protein BCR38DRAFT_160158 [Pseudomassariella vexata]ORY67573.1 hypothetical protein BCR38DRAFT_160158 [Pseudomassariella vexata]